MSEETRYRIGKRFPWEVFRFPLIDFMGLKPSGLLKTSRSAGFAPDKAFIWSMAAIKLAAARVNASLGLLPVPISEAIQKASQEIMDGQWDDQFVVDPFQAGAGTSHHMNINEVTAARANQILAENNPADMSIQMTMSIWRNPPMTSFPPPSVWAACGGMDELDEVLQSASTAFAEKSVEFDTVIKSGRTHLQDAVPVRLGQEFGAYATAINRDRDRIQQAAAGLVSPGDWRNSRRHRFECPPTVCQPDGHRAYLA